MHSRRTLVSVFPGLLLLCLPYTSRPESSVPAPAAMDRDLMEVTVQQLQHYYAEHRYTVTQVVQWHLARVHRYNGLYRAVETSLDRAALETAAREDADAAAGRGNSAPLWGVPIVIKANTSIAGKVTTDGWEGYIIPGHESWRRVTRRSWPSCARPEQCLSATRTCPISPTPIPTAAARSAAPVTRTTCAFLRAARQAEP